MKHNHHIVADIAETSKIGLAGILAGVFCLIFAVVYTIIHHARNK